MTKRRKSQDPLPGRDEAEKHDAIHEAGHAVMMHLLGQKVRVVSIDPDPVGPPGNRSYVYPVDPSPDQNTLRAIKVRLAGLAAERILFEPLERRRVSLKKIARAALRVQSSEQDYALHDLKEALALAHSLHGDASGVDMTVRPMALAHLEGLWQETLRVLVSPRNLESIMRLATQLTGRRTILGEEIAAMDSDEDWQKENPLRRWREAKAPQVTTGDAALSLEIDVERLRNLEQGLAQPTPEELAEIGKLIGDPNIEEHWNEWRLRDPSVETGVCE